MTDSDTIGNAEPGAGECACPGRGGAGDEDRRLVANLLANDHRVWEHVLTVVAAKMVNTRRYSEMLARTNHEPVEVVTTLCEELFRDDFARLRAFRFQGPFDGWLYWEVRRAVKIVTGLEGKSGGINRSEREIAVDPNDEAGVFGRMPQGRRQDVAGRLMDARELYVRLWKDNAEGAYVFFMKEELGLPAKQIAAILGRSPNSVDQIFHRVRCRLRDMVAEK